jgi:hypothetical protein
VHHIHKLADIRKKGRRAKPEWMKTMIALRRKTLVICHACHVNIHAGRPTGMNESGEPGVEKSTSPVRRGADGKGQ